MPSWLKAPCSKLRSRPTTIAAFVEPCQSVAIQSKKRYAGRQEDPMRTKSLVALLGVTLVLGASHMTVDALAQGKDAQPAGEPKDARVEAIIAKLRRQGTQRRT